MAGEKRSLGSGNTSPHKAARTLSDESSDIGLPSSQVSQQTSSRLYTSGLTDKSLGSMSESEKCQWRTYDYPESFCNFAGWEQAHQERFIHDFHWDRPRNGFQNWLESMVNDELVLLKYKLENFKLNEAIYWDNMLLKRNSTVDNMVRAWIDVKKISYTLSTDYIHGLVNHMKKILPKVKQVVREAQYNDAERFFYIEERNSRGRLPSSIPCQKLNSTVVQSFFNVIRL